MTASLKQAGTQPLTRELFIFDKIRGPTVSSTSLSRPEGNKGYVLVFICEPICVKEERENRFKVNEN